MNPELAQDFVLKLAFVTSRECCGNLANCCRTAMRKKYFDHDGLILLGLERVTDADIVAVADRVRVMMLAGTRDDA